MLMARIFAVTCLLLGSVGTWAVVDGHKYPFETPEDTARFQFLAEELRCPKCQNQNLADSNAPVAADMRDKVYELMQEGQSNDEIVGYLVARYGDFVRYRPAMKAETYFLWFGPLLALLAGVGVLIAIRRGSRKTALTPLSDAEKKRLNELQDKGDPS